MRLFVGIKIDVPPELTRIKRELHHAHSKWVTDTNYHLTLVFIGQTEPEDIGKISKTLSKIVGHHPPFNLKIKGVGKFQNRRSSGVLWLGVEDNVVLKKLHNEVSDSLLKILPNLKNQYKDYTPHITVARIKGKEELDHFKLLFDKLNLKMQQRVNEILLYESVSAPLACLSGRQGVEYKVLERFGLNEKGRSKKNRP